MHITKKKRKKLDDKSMRCILLEYSSKSKGYKLMDPITQKIYIIKYLSFDKTSEFLTSPLAIVPQPDSEPIINYAE